MPKDFSISLLQLENFRYSYIHVGSFMRVYNLHDIVL